MIKVESLGLNATELSNLINEWIIGKNAERDREILKDNLVDGKSQYQLSDKYDLSLPQIKNILRERKKQLFKHVH